MMKLILVPLLIAVGLCACKPGKPTPTGDAKVPAGKGDKSSVADTAEEARTAPQKWYDETRELYYRIPVRVSYFPEDPEVTRSVWAALKHYDDVFNDFKEGTEVWKINRLNAAGSVSLSPLMTEAMSKSRAAHRISGGVFDVTSAPLRKLWRTAGKIGRKPSETEVNTVKKMCGMDLVKLENRTLQVTKAGIRFDFGGIVKGMAADLALSLLKKAGATSALVQVGGESVVYGLSPKKRGYRLGLRHPKAPGNNWCVVQDPGSGFSVSTSGNYEQPIMINGQAYYHIFDPRTGLPAKTTVLSVSVIFPEPGKNWLADSLSTTGAILGPEKTFEIVERLGGDAMILIQEGDQIVEKSTKGWKAYIK
jgi:thiamine biosynthesis lipoprotein